MSFGNYIRELREELDSQPDSGGRYSLRQLAIRIDVEPSYLSKVERNCVAPPSEQTIRRLAAELGEDSDLLLAIAGKVPNDVQEIIKSRPDIYCALIRRLDNASPDTLNEILSSLD